VLRPWRTDPKESPFVLSKRLAAKREPRVEGRAMGEAVHWIRAAPFDRVCLLASLGTGLAQGER